MTRYSLRFGTTRIPMVEVLRVPLDPNEQIPVERKVYGFTTQHAYRRALRWARQHGDPR